MDIRVDLLYRGIQTLGYVYSEPHGLIIPYNFIIDYVERHSLVQNLNIVDVFLARLEKEGKLEVVRQTFDPDLIAGVRLK